MKSSSLFTSGWARAAAGLVVAFAFVASSGLSFLSQPDVARAATALLTDGFDSTPPALTSSVNDIPDWNERGDDDGSLTRAQAPSNSGEDIASPNGGRFAKIGYDSGNAQSQNDDKPEWICRQINTAGYENLVLSYYWNGDNDTETNSDFGVVEYRATSNGSTDNTCNSNESSWTVLNTHDLNTELDWSDLVTVNLPDELDNDNSWFIRFRNDASSNQEFFRVDGVTLEGDEIKTTIQIKKLIDLDGNIETTDDQTPASGWSFTLNGDSPFVTDETGMTAVVEVEDKENYDIAEVLQANYQLLSASCVGANKNGEFEDGEIENVKLKIGEEALCTFINAPERGSITVTKVLAGNEEGTLEAADFTLEVSGDDEFTETGNGVVVADELIPGTYYVSEEGEAGYEQTSIECVAGEANVSVGQDGSLTVAPGQDIECVITNTFIPEDDGGQGGEGDQCEVTEVIVSDTLTLNEDESPSVVLTFIHSAWNTVATALGASEWIWSAEPMPEGYVADVTKTFTRSFTIDGAPLSGTLKIAADNGYAVTLNGDPLCADAGEFNYSSVDTCVIDAADLEQGLNIIEFTVTNKAQSGGTLESNPAGLIYELSITEDTCAEPEEPLCVNEPEGGWADTVVESDQGLKKGGAAVAANRSVVSDVLDEADWTVGGSTGFFSLGFGGTITVAFDSFVPNVEGNDISIHEATNGVYPQESALIEVSQDGSTWYAVGTSASNGAVTYFDFDATGLAWIKYVRITDTTNPALHNNDADGFDLDAVDATQTVCEEPIVAQCVPGQELLANGNFETPTVTNSAKWDIFPSNTPGLGWVVEWLNPSGAPLIANLEIQKNGLFPGGASNGTQWIELDSDWDGPSGSISGEAGAVAISQTILTEVGETYTFSFDFSARPNTAVAQNAVRVLVDGDSTLVDQTVSAVNAVTQNTWLPQSFTFVADSILTTVSLSDAGASNNSIGTLIDNASLMCTPPEVPKFASVTLCKVDTQAQGLPGWTLLLEKGDAVDSFSVPSTSSAGTNSTPLTAGTSYVAVATGVWLNDREPDNHVDAEYSTEDGWTTHVDGFTGYQDDILELQIAQTSGAWGAYNSLHSYAQAFTPGANGPVNFRIFDGTGSTPNESWYGDNSGSLNVVITEGYAGITGENGCVTFTGVPYGTYDISEMLQDGWVADSENPSTAVVDSPEETFTFVNAPVQPDPETATLHATKIVCEAEEYLPNWGDGQTVSEITATTAAEFLAEVNEGPGPDHCWLEDGWEFQWVSNSGSSSNPGDNILTPAPSPWASTGLTALDGTVSATVPAGERIWVREVLKENYVQFGGQNTHAHVSAELYCSTDVLNYDNWDYIDPVNEDASYYCVAFNAPVAPQCGPDQHVNSENQCEDNNNESHADVWVEKEVSGGPYEVGSSVTYTITVGNEGPFVANTIVVTDLLPAGLVYSGHDASNEGPSDDFYNEVTGVWTIASLGVDGVAVLEIYAEIAEGFEDETITNIVTVETASEDDTSENDEDSVAIFVDDEDEGGGGGSGPEIQSFFGANGPISGLGGGPLGQVLGASTEGQVLGESCGLYLDKFIRFNRNNDAEQVRKLQQFLNKWLGLSLPLTGFYGPLTYEAVLQFQTQYAETILTPWGLTSPTGIVYLTTLRQINMLECPVLSLELPPLTPWTN